MKSPVYSSVRHDPPNSHGDCLRACVATLLGGDPPHFFHDGCEGDVAFARLNEWVAKQGLVVSTTLFDGSASLTDVLEAWGGMNKHVPSILIASTARDDHCVCMNGGEIVHDPNPGLSPIVKANSNGYWNIITFVKL